MIVAKNVTTNFTLGGYKITESLGIVRGTVVRLMTVFGGNNDSAIYSNLCETARQNAYDQMVAHAESMGANAVIGFRYDTNEVIKGVTEVLAYGTACKMEEI